MSEGQIVSHYGIHWDAENTVAYLEQGRGSANAIGLKKKSGFVVKLPSGKKHCNHQIPIAAPVPADQHWDYFMTLQEDPLMRAMLPIPKADAGCFFITEGPNVQRTLVLLSKLSSPIYPIIVPIWAMTLQAVLSELQTTNLQPFVLHGVEAKNSEMVKQIAEAAAYLPRRVIFVGAADVVLPPLVKRITTKLTSDAYSLDDLTMLPWEQLGATVVRKFMRREWHPK